MSVTNPGMVEVITEPANGVRQIRDRVLGDMSLQESDAVAVSGGEVVGATLAGATQAISAAGAIDIDANYVAITGPAASTYAVTLAAPARPGQLMVIEMVATTSTNAVTLALTNVVGGTAASSASFDAANETLALVSIGNKWAVLAEIGVTLS